MTTATMQKSPTASHGDLAEETVISGRVVDDSGHSVGGASVVLLDDNQEFAAELIATPAGGFRFFAAPGTWTIKALSGSSHGVVTLAPAGTGINKIEIKLDVRQGLLPPR